MQYHTLVRSIVIGLIVILSTVVYAQDNDTPQKIEVGDTIEVTLEAESETLLYIDLEIGQSILITSISDIDWSLWMVDSEGEPAIGVYNERMARLVARATDTYEIQLANRNKVTGDVTLTISDVDAHEIELGEHYEYEAGDFPIFEVVFMGDAGQSVLIESSNTDIRYTFERINVDGSVISMLPSLNNLDRITGIELREDTQYRVVTDIYGMTEMPEDGYIAVREPDLLTGNVTIGSVIEDTADNELAHYTIDLDVDQQLHATVLSELGSQLYITNSGGIVLEYFGHALVPHEFAPLTFIAPETDTYTIHILYPPTGNLLRGTFTFVVSDELMLKLDEGPHTIDFTAEHPHVFSTRVREGEQYRLTITSEEELNGTIQAEFYELPHHTLLDVQVDSEPAEYIFEAKNTVVAVLVLTGLDDIDTTISVSLDPIAPN